MMFHVIVSSLVLSALTSVFAVPSGSHGLVNTGHSAQYRTEDNYGNYEFGYNEDHAEGGTFRKERGTAHGVVGSYGLRGADGRMRIVHYIADEHGFRATIETNEPGVDVKQSPAGVDFANGHQVHPAPHAHEDSLPVYHSQRIHHPEHVHHVEPVHHVQPAYDVEPEYRHHNAAPLALSHSVPTPVIAAPIHSALPYHSQLPEYEGVLAPLMHAEAHSAYSQPEPMSAALQYVPEDGMHYSAFDGDFGRRFSYNQRGHL